MNNIPCPHCGKQVEISEAFKHQVEDEIKKSYSKKFDEEIEAAKRQARLKAEEDAALKLKDTTEEARETKEKNRELQDQLLELTKATRQLKQKDEERELEMQKKLALESDKIRIDAQKKAEEEQHSKIAEKDKQLADIMKELEETRRKMQQGSQQLQGEVFEEEFENTLRQQYPNDVITPVGKGIRGGDIIQEVWDKKGNLTGKILWELKNTKTWSEGWIEKLRADQRSISAEESVLISYVLPTDMKVAGFRNGVWVTKQDFVLSLADTLRTKLIQLYYARKAADGKDEKMNYLHRYLTGTEFKHRVEAIIESFSSMQTEIEKEKRYFANKWARDEKNVRQVIDNTIGMQGDLRGIIGGALPQIKGLELQGEENDEDIELQQTLL